MGRSASVNKVRTKQIQSWAIAVGAVAMFAVPVLGASPASAQTVLHPAAFSQIAAATGSISGHLNYPFQWVEAGAKSEVHIALYNPSAGTFETPVTFSPGHVPLSGGVSQHRAGQLF